MRILYVIDSLAPGGAETSLAEMAPGLVAGGVDLHVLPLRNRLDMAPRIAQAGGTVHARDSQTGRIGNVRAVIHVARQIRPDLIHTTLYESDIAGRTAAGLLRIPSSTSIVNDSYGPAHYAESKTMKLHGARALDAATARLATRLHAVSATIAVNVPSRLGIAYAEIDVVPRGRDPKNLPFRANALHERTRAALGISECTPVVLAVGRHEPQKGLGHLLDALSLVAAEYPDAVVLIAGKDGRSSEGLRALANGIPLDIRFLGHRTDVPALLSAADVLCFPSEREGSPGTLIEALAVGCPVVASAIPPVIEVVGGVDDCAVTLTLVGDSHEIGVALNRTLREAGLLEVRLLRGRSRFERLYSIDSVVERMIEFFRRAANRNAGTNGQRAS